MDQAPNYYSYVPTQFGPAPPPYMGEQFQQEYYGDYSFQQQHPAVDPFMDAVNAEVWAAVQAARSMDAQSLHLAYANLGFVLGIDKACTYFVQSYSSSYPAFGSRKLFYKKDWENLEAMVADIDNEKKILHVEEFMRRRRIPGYVSLYAPKQIVCKGVEKAVKQEKISCATDACRDEVMRLDVACQTMDQSTISLNVACQTEKFRGLETGCQTEKSIGLETACQTEKFAALEVACQTVEKSAGSSVSCQTTETCEKASRKSVDKVAGKDTGNSKRARDDEHDSRSAKRSKHSVSTGDARSKVSSQDAKSSTHQNGSERKSREKDDKIVRKDSANHKHQRGHEAETSASSEQRPILNNKMRTAKSLFESKKKLIEAVDGEKSSRKSSEKIMLKDSSANCKRDRDDKSESSVSHSKRSASKDSTQKCEATKNSASKSVSCRTTAFDSKKSSRDSIVTSSGKVLDLKGSAHKPVAAKRSVPKTDAIDGEKSSRKSNGKIVLKDSSDNCKRDGSASHSKRSASDVTSSGKVPGDSKRNGGVTEAKRSSPDCKENAQTLGKSDCHVTKLVIQNLHPLVNDVDISTIFSVFKSYKSSKVNFYNYGKLGAADVVFEEEADALEAKNQFDGKKLDGFPMQIVVVKSEKK